MCIYRIFVGREFDQYWYLWVEQKVYQRGLLCEDPCLAIICNGGSELLYFTPETWQKSNTEIASVRRKQIDDSPEDMMILRKKKKITQHAHTYCWGLGWSNHCSSYVETRRWWAYGAKGWESQAVHCWVFRTQKQFRRFSNWKQLGCINWILGVSEIHLSCYKLGSVASL